MAVNGTERDSNGIDGAGVADGVFATNMSYNRGQGAVSIRSEIGHETKTNALCDLSAKSSH